MARKVIREISLNGKKHISLNFASSLCGYHKDYLGQLIRGGKLQATRFENSWFIESDEFARFCEKNGIAVKEITNKAADPKPLIRNTADSWDKALLGLSSETVIQPSPSIPVPLHSTTVKDRFL